MSVTQKSAVFIARECDAIKDKTAALNGIISTVAESSFVARMLKIKFCGKAKESSFILNSDHHIIC